MPRYYIDTDDGSLFITDDEGREYASIAAARAMAQRAVVDMAHRLIPDGEHRTFTAAIRDENGTVLYVATLSFDGEWKISPPVG